MSTAQNPLSCVIEPALNQILSPTPFAPVPFGSPPRVRVVCKAVLSPTKKGKIAGPSSPVKPQPTKTKLGVKRRLLDLDEPTAIVPKQDARHVTLSTVFRVQLPTGEWLCFAAQMDLHGGGLDELQRPTKRRVINSLPSMCEGMRMSSVKLCLVGSAVDRVCRPHVVEVANVLDFFKSLNVDASSQCTILSFHNATWTESGLGYCSVLGDQLAIRAKEEPLKLLVQQTVTEYKAFQQDAHCILTYAMGPLRSDEQDQLIGILFDRQRTADRIAMEISAASGLPRVDYSCTASPHTVEGHECTATRAVVYNRILKRREGHGLVCVDTNALSLSVYVEYENEPYNFAKFTHKINHEQRSHYQRTSSGFITLGGNEWALTCDRTNGTESEDNLWRLIQASIAKQSEQALEKARREKNGVMALWKKREESMRKSSEQTVKEVAAAKKKAADAQVLESLKGQLDPEVLAVAKKLQNQKSGSSSSTAARGKENASTSAPQAQSRGDAMYAEAIALLEKNGVLASTAASSSRHQQQHQNSAVASASSSAKRSALENALERLNELIFAF